MQKGEQPDLGCRGDSLTYCVQSAVQVLEAGSRLLLHRHRVIRLELRPGQKPHNPLAWLLRARYRASHCSLVDLCARTRGGHHSKQVHRGVPCQFTPDKHLVHWCVCCDSKHKFARIFPSSTNSRAFGQTRGGQYAYSPHTIPYLQLHRQKVSSQQQVSLRWHSLRQTRPSGIGTAAALGPRQTFLRPKSPDAEA